MAASSQGERRPDTSSPKTGHQHLEAAPLSVHFLIESLELLDLELRHSPGLQVQVVFKFTGPIRIKTPDEAKLILLGA